MTDAFEALPEQSDLDTILNFIRVKTHTEHVRTPHIVEYFIKESDVINGVKHMKVWMIIKCLRHLCANNLLQRRNMTSFKKKTATTTISYRVLAQTEI